MTGTVGQHPPQAPNGTEDPADDFLTAVITPVGHTAVTAVAANPAARPGRAARADATGVAAVGVSVSVAAGASAG
jgi:hypothetical protein